MTKDKLTKNEAIIMNLDKPKQPVISVICRDDMGNDLFNAQCADKESFILIIETLYENAKNDKKDVFEVHITEYDV